MPSTTPDAPLRDGRGVGACSSRSLPGSVRAWRLASPTRGVASIEHDTRSTLRCVRTALRFFTCCADRGVLAYLIGDTVECGVVRGLFAASGLESSAAGPFAPFTAGYARCAAACTIRAIAAPVAALPAARAAATAPAAAAALAAAARAAAVAGPGAMSPCIAALALPCGRAC